MKVLSSGFTFLMKKVFPTFWLGIVAVFIVVALADGRFMKEPILLVAPVLMLAFGYFLFRALVWSLADEVRDGGDYLLVRKSGSEEKVLLSDIVNVSMSTMTNPPRLSLRLRKAGRFGDEVVFMPVSGLRLNPFARNPVAEDLIRRVDRARGSR